MKSQSFDNTLFLCDQINTDQANYQVVVLSEIFKSQLENEEITKNQIVEKLVKIGHSKRPITKKSRIAYFGSDCPVWSVLTKKALISKSGKFIQSTISENTTKTQLRELIDILEKKI
tara:strand:- start:187 stop:537 length:351 start_codon:yes stop_codon:yes gene_type:complete